MNIIIVTYGRFTQYLDYLFVQYMYTRVYKFQRISTVVDEECVDYWLFESISSKEFLLL